MVLGVNHVPIFSYDGMGNLTNDGSTAYTTTPKAVRRSTSLPLGQVPKRSRAT
jgi:hypothetical protein